MQTMRCTVHLPALLVVLSAAAAQAQPAVIEGYVRDGETGMPLPGATVTLERHERIEAGAVADSAGFYSLMAAREASYLLVTRHVSYTTVVLSISVRSDTLRQDLSLVPTIVGLEEVEISVTPFQSPSDVSVAITKVSARTVRGLAGSGEDVLQALRMFPGVQTSGDYSTQLYIRGGTPDQNLILIDDIEVFSPYQLSGMGSLLNPELVRSIELYPGTMPAAYGDRLSSALVVATREGRTDGRLHGRINSTLMTINTTLEGVTGFWGGSWIASVRKTYFGSFANTFARRIGVFNEIAFPDFTDGHFKLSLRPVHDHIARITVLTSRDRLDWVVDEDAVAVQGDSESLYRGGKDITHTAVGLQWRYVPDEATSARLYANWYKNSGSSMLGGGLQAWMAGLKSFDSPFDPPDPVFPSDAEAQFSQSERYTVRKASVGTRLVLVRGAHSLEAGAGLDHLATDLVLEFQANAFGHSLFEAIRMADPLFTTLGDSADVAQTSLRGHIFFQDRIELANRRLFLQPALRFDYYGLAARRYLTPRLSVSIPLGGRTTVRLAGGRYVQSPGLEKTLDPDNHYNTVRFESLAGLAAEEAWHAGMSLTTYLARRWRVRLQGYQKWYHKLLTRDSRVQSQAVAAYFPVGSTEVGRVSMLTPSAWIIEYQDAPVLLPDLINAGSGQSAGVELLVARERLRPEDRLSGWLSYALASASREARYGSSTPEHPFAYDRRHTANIVLQWQATSSFTAGLTWRYGSGFPYTPAADMRALVALVEDPEQPGVTQEVVMVDPETGYARLVPVFGGPENFYSARLPAYHRLDLRVTYTARWQSLAVRVYADAINAYNRRNTITNKYFVRTDAGDYEHLPEALRPPPIATLYREPVYGFPLIPSLGLSCSF